MKIEIGKYYRRRDGIAWGPVCSGILDGFPFRIGDSHYTQDGRMYKARVDSVIDLISEVFVYDEPMGKPADPEDVADFFNSLADEAKIFDAGHAPLDATDLMILANLRKQGFLTPAKPDQAAEKRAEIRRDIAAKVMAGLCASSSFDAGSEWDDWGKLAKEAVTIADALLKELDR